MKILHINSYFSVSKFYKNLYDIQKLHALNFDVYIPVSKSYIKSDDIVFGEYSIIRKNHNKYDRLLFNIKHKKIIKDAEENLDVSNYSIIHAHSLFSNGYIAYKLKKKYNVPYIVAVRNTDVNVFFKKMLHLRNLGVNILKEADKIIFLSNSYKNKVLSEYIPMGIIEEISNKSVIVPNGLDKFWVENLNVPQKIKTFNEIKLLYVGNIDKNKNISTTLKSIELLKNKGYNVTYTVVGKIIDHSIGKEIKKMPFVQYIEPKSKEELIKIYREHDIFIMPSIYETFGLVYVEAMSQGVPVIYSRGQGFDEQFKEGVVGYSVNSKDFIEIAEAILRIIENYEHFSLNTIDNIKIFNWGKIAEKYSGIYKYIIKNNKF